jgi:hypothetical protein
MPNAEFKTGDVLAGLEPDEHVEVQRIVPFGDKTRYRRHVAPGHQASADT